MAAFLSEVDAEPAPAAPKIIAAGPTVISAKPSGPSSHQPGQLSATVVEAGGTVRRLPVSEWAKPEELARQIAAEGLPMPQLPHQMGLLPPGARRDDMMPPVTPPFIPSTTFSGARPGYVFKSGQLGVGYYHENAGSAPFVPPLPQAPRPPGLGPPAASGSMVASSSQQYGVSAPGERNITRTVAGMVWKDKTLLDWPEDDFRVFIGDLGNEVNDDVLTHAFQRYPSFQMARVIKDKGSGKTKGYGFASFKDPWDMTKALREMQGKYVGNRPIKIRKSTAAERQVTETNQPVQFSHALGVADKSTARALEKGGAIQKKKIHKNKNKHLPW